MVPAMLEPIRPLLEMASRASEPLALLALGAVLIAISIRLRSHSARPAEPVPPPATASSKSGSRLAARPPLATTEGRG